MKKIIALFMVLVLLLLVVDSSAFSVRTVSKVRTVTAKDLTFYDSLDLKHSGFEITSNLDKSTRIDKTILTEHNYSYENCKKLDYHNSPEDKLDIVFVASHFYTETGPGSKFAQDVELFKQKFYDFPQYANNIEKFNFYRVDGIDPDDTCSSFGGTPSCPGLTFQRERVIALAEQCQDFDLNNNDQIVVLFDSDVIPLSAAKAEPKWDVAYMPSSAIYLMMHEFGHSFGKLGDERDGTQPNPYIDPVFPNCASPFPGFTCEDRWGDLFGIGGVGCFQGCGATNFFRPTYNDSIMRGGQAVLLDHFCPIGKRYVNSLLSIYTDDVISNPSCIILFDELKISYNSVNGNSNFNSNLDFNSDNKIDLVDFSMFAFNYYDDTWCSTYLN